MKELMVFVFLGVLLTGEFASAGSGTPAAYRQSIVENGTYYFYVPLVLNNYCRDPVILAVGDSITEGVYTSSPSGNGLSPLTGTETGGDLSS